jgi:hypothetical protein
VVVEKVASAGPTNYPLLMKTNYNDWMLLMKIKLEARLLWTAVDLGDVDFQVDCMALDAICSAVPPELTTDPAAMHARRAGAAFRSRTRRPPHPHLQAQEPEAAAARAAQSLVTCHYQARLIGRPCVVSVTGSRAGLVG